MTRLSDVDAALLLWANRFNERHTPNVTARGITGMPIKRANRTRQSSPGDVRQRLQGIVQRRPQVMVKISGGGRGMRSIRAHLNYISRNGQLPVETQEGERVLGRDELESMSEEWRTGGFPIDEVSTIREAYNVVLSMPAGTDAAALHRAAIAFAQDEFSKHQYALVLHTFENDPNRDPSENPHAHVCVKARGFDGVRLNPRKSDLRRWRDQFAERLREQGVQAEASSRVDRLQPGLVNRQAEYHIRAREGTKGVESGAGPSTPYKPKWPDSKNLALNQYASLARALAVSAKVSDRELAVGITAVAAGTRERLTDREMDR